MKDVAEIEDGRPGPNRPASHVTRRTVIAGGLAQIAGGPLLAATPAGYAWQPADIPSGTTIGFDDRHGRRVDLKAFAGRPVLLNIWATWCAPCILELPALDRLQKDFDRRLTVIALSVDRSGMPAVVTALRRLSVRRLQAFVDRDGDTMAKLRLESLPATFTISASGTFLQRRRGRVDWDVPAERDALRTMLRL